MKVAIVAVMVVLAMSVAFVGGLLVASKVIASRQEQPVKKAPPIVAAQISPEGEGAKAKEGEIVKGHEAKAKPEPKKPTTDEMIALVDFNEADSRDASKVLFRRKVAEEMEATEKQFELESEKAQEKARLAASLQRWLDRTKNQ